MRLKCLCCGILLLAVSVMAQTSDPTISDDLLGRWSGEPPMGGKLEIIITSVAGGKINGSALIPTGSRRGERPILSGEVEAQKVTIQTQYPRTGTIVTYHCDFKNKGELPCVTKGAKHSTTFLKLN